MKKVIVFVLVPVIMICLVMSWPSMKLETRKMFFATPEKREAISNIQQLLHKHKRHYLAMKCIGLIFTADRNVEIIEKMAEYAIVEGSGTGTYIQLAEYAAQSKIADYEFLDIAELIKKSRGNVSVELALQASKAQTREELKEVRNKIDELKKKYTM